jgi:hypothetical protein
MDRSQSLFNFFRRESRHSVLLFVMNRIGEYSEGLQQTAMAKSISCDSLDPFHAILYLDRHACDF